MFKKTTQKGTEFVFAEALLFSSIAIAIGYLLGADDPLGVEKNAWYFLITLTVITLYSGLGFGLLSLIPFSLALFTFYNRFPYDFFLWHLLFTLILGEFQYIWDRRIEQIKEEKKYLEEKLDDMGKNYFLLRASHEQLERNYILRPFSARSALLEVRNKLIENSNSGFEWIMVFLSKICNIEKASLYIKENNKGGFKEAGSTGGSTPLELNDPLLYRAIQEKGMLFIGNILDKQFSKYIAVIPILNDAEEISAVLLIEDMPFLSLNKDNLFTINLILSYFFDEINAIDLIGGSYKDIPFYDPIILKEIYKLSRLKKKAGAESAVVVFDFSNSPIGKNLFSLVQSKMRGADMVCSYEKEGLKALVLLFLTHSSGAIDFIDRIMTGIGETFGMTEKENIKYKIIPVSDDHKKTIEAING